MKDEIYLMTIEELIKENLELKRQVEQLKKICKMHARAIDFYIRKLNELEGSAIEKFELRVWRRSDGDVGSSARKG